MQSGKDSMNFLNLFSVLSKEFRGVIFDFGNIFDNDDFSSLAFDI